MSPSLVEAESLSPTFRRELDLALITSDEALLSSLAIPAPGALLGGDISSLFSATAAASHPLRPALSSFLSLSSHSHAPTPHNYAAAVALLTHFLRTNFAGPPPERAPSPLVADAVAAAADLALDGEAAPTTVVGPALLLAAETFFVENAAALVADGFVFARWWAARAALAHHAVLSKPTPTLHSRIFFNFHALLGEASSACGTLQKGGAGQEGAREAPATGEWDLMGQTGDGIGCELLALAHLELCMAQRKFYDVDGAAKSLSASCRLADMVVQVKGQLGVRTKFQQTPISQLVARAFAGGADNRAPAHGVRCRFPQELQNGDESGNHTEHKLPRNVPLDDSDVLGYVKLEPGDDSGRAGEGLAELSDLTPLEQGIVLAHGAIELARSASHTLTEEQAAPFVSRVLASVDSRFGTSSVVQMRALVLRTRFESERGRYMERSMTQMEAVNEFVDAKAGGSNYEDAVERIAMLLACGLPPRWELKKELAVSLGRLGLVKSAMEIFRELQFWDELVDCHRLIGDVGAAEELVRDQLADLEVAVEVATSPGDVEEAKARQTERRPRLLCVLGDVTRDADLYSQAWDESGCRFGRAKRSLGRVAVEHKQWDQAVVHFKDALKLNPLLPDIWFTYGCSAMQTGDMQLAANAFTHVVQETPDNGEAWNNLGRVLSEIGRKKEALSALLMAAKTKRDSWRIWDNLLLVATETRAGPEIIKAMEQLIELRGKQAVSATPLLVAIDEVVRAARGTDSNERAAVGQMCRALLKVLARATTLVSSDPALWAAYARLHDIVPGKESRLKSAECRQREIRVLISKQDWKLEAGPFTEMAKASHAFAHSALNSEDESLITAASFHVRSVIAQTEEVFGTNAAFESLREAQAMLDAS